MRVHMSQWMLVLFVILSAINIALFLFWFSLIELHVFPSEKGSWDYALNSISAQITILEAAIVVVSVFLAVLGIIGYTQIKDNALDAATDTAMKVASDKIDIFVQSLEKKIEEEEQRNNLDLSGSEEVEQ